jgi:hypothetical protein
MVSNHWAKASSVQITITTIKYIFIHFTIYFYTLRAISFSQGSAMTGFRWREIFQYSFIVCLFVAWSEEVIQTGYSKKQSSTFLWLTVYIRIT